MSKPVLYTNSTWGIKAQNKWWASVQTQGSHPQQSQKWSFIRKNIVLEKIIQKTTLKICITSVNIINDYILKVKTKILKQ